MFACLQRKKVKCTFIHSFPKGNTRNTTSPNCPTRKISLSRNARSEPSSCLPQAVQALADAWDPPQALSRLHMSITYIGDWPRPHLPTHTSYPASLKILPNYQFRRGASP